MTLALTFVWATEALADVLLDLLLRLQQRGVRLARLDLDREFASVAILRWLAQQPFLSVVALPKRGQRLKALLVGERDQQTTYTMTSADDGTITFPLWIAYEPPAAPDARPVYLPFAVLGSRPADLDVAGVAAAYRQRFGIEASYRQDNQ
ncbi:MAG: hypothetical protein HY329_03605, partial [Chloroflexi bacterium]|nr:hypothetical protein [Chloroflexota bacterium]